MNVTLVVSFFLLSIGIRYKEGYMFFLHLMNVRHVSISIVLLTLYAVPASSSLILSAALRKHMVIGSLLFDVLDIILGEPLSRSSFAKRYSLKPLFTSLLVPLFSDLFVHFECLCCCLVTLICSSLTLTTALSFSWHKI